MKTIEMNGLKITAPRLASPKITGPMRAGLRLTGLFVVGMILSGRMMAQTEKSDKSEKSDNKEQLVVPLSEPGKAFKLEVHLISGSITVSTYEGKDIVIDAVGEERKRRSEDRESSNGMHRIATGGGMELTAEERNNKVTISSNSFKSPIDLMIKIPKGETTLNIGTVNNGNIIVNNVAGEMEITNVNGRIDCNNISGSVVGNTVNGNVIVTFSKIDPKAPMAFSTLNGNVDITFPADIKANVKLKSDRGGIYSDFDVDIDKNEPKVKRSSESGMYRLTIEDWVYGKINGGGPEMLMKNMNGSIYIRKAK
ncbi:MAG TPA: DUF4097 family beta strand repeat-containing protein [Puia sp.]|nr:DUF4097 family beta strand repeat-containing protein [Puia sp.]